MVPSALLPAPLLKGPTVRVAPGHRSNPSAGLQPLEGSAHAPCWEAAVADSPRNVSLGGLCFLGTSRSLLQIGPPLCTDRLASTALQGFGLHRARDDTVVTNSEEAGHHLPTDAHADDAIEGSSATMAKLDPEIPQRTTQASRKCVRRSATIHRKRATSGRNPPKMAERKTHDK